MKRTEYFKLFSHNVAVKGKERSTIYNLQRSDIKFIPNSLYDVLEKLETQSINEVKDLVKPEERIIFESYIEFLLKNDFGFITFDHQEYPKMSMQWRTPNKINTAVIEYDFNDPKYSLQKLIYQLDELLCFHIEVRLRVRDCNDIVEFSSYTKGLVFRSVSLIVEYVENIEDTVENIFEENQKLDYIIVHNYPTSGMFSKKFENQVNYLEENIYSDLHKKHFPDNNYIVNVKYFTESKSYHTYYNKRVCINWDGNLKNCLLHLNDYGNINDVDVREVIETSEFKELWKVNPDRVLDYKEDELRYSKFYTHQLEKVDDYFYKVVS
ncbi:hypothetical protein [Tenacibaculum ascidiaceicola]|uniref:hypothetical protein n=1 Tax=Tenacibaculum ascidiaceicola TaxID=1699411 RepID=UPI003892DF85